MDKILYFSGTGNTAFIAEHIEKRLMDEGVDVSSERIEESDPGNCRGIDTLYFGFPVYACDMPGFLIEYIEALPEGNGTPVRLFNTMAFFSGKAMLRAAVLFADKGYSITSFFEKKMPGSDGLALLKKGGRTAEKLLSNFNNDMSDLYQWMKENEKIRNVQKPIDIGGRVIGFLMNKIEGVMKKKYRTDERCISCGLCTRICPVGNIQMVDKKIQFGNNCILCMRCIHQCPVEAIQIGKMTVDKFRYKGPEGDFYPGL
ncbi:MAG TPA: hypothetical protein DCO79_02135 [Spirochaeta sp.]|nr:hypothetical protein [Spirochaeta sp.]